MPVTTTSEPARHDPSRARVALRVAGSAVAALAVVLLVAAMILLRDQRPRIETRRSRLASATVAPAPERDSLHRVELVHLRATSGLDVELAVKHPSSGAAATGDGAGAPAATVARIAQLDGTAADCPDGRRPAVILLGGHRTGRNAVHLVSDTRGTIVAAMSYPFAGNHRAKGMQIVRQIPEIRRAIFDTPAALMLVVDHLAAHPCVDPARIEAAGVSLGAPFVVIAGAMDERIARVWAVHGGGGVYEPLEFNLRRQVGSRLFSIPLAGLATLLLSGDRLAPERWAGELAPRPFVMVNALHDERIPRASVDRLYRSASEPKEMIWMPGAHVRSEAEVVRPLIQLVLDRVTTETSEAPPPR